jgi:hypothetical protein
MAYRWERGGENLIVPPLAIVKEPDPTRSSLTGQALIVLAALMALLWFLEVRRAPLRVLERRDCANAYAAARTPADTMAVDARQPLGARRTDSLAVTCGSLRSSGRL